MKDQYFLDNLDPAVRVRYLKDEGMPLKKGDVRFLEHIDNPEVRQDLMLELLESGLEMSNNAKSLLLKGTGRWIPRS